MTKFVFSIFMVLVILFATGCTGTSNPTSSTTPKPSNVLPPIITMEVPLTSELPPVTYSPAPIKTPSIKYPNVWTTYTNTDLVTSLLLQKDHLWVGTQGGALDFNLVDRTFIKYTSTNSRLPGNFVRSIASDSQGNLWFATDRGVVRVEGSKWTQFSTADALVSDDTYAIDTDNSGNVWIALLGRRCQPL